MKVQFCGELSWRICAGRRAGMVMAMDITNDLVAYVAQLAHLKIEQAQLPKAREDLARMIGYVDRLSELDTNGVEPMSHAFPVVNIFREDVEVPCMDRELILQNAPAAKDGCFVVPKTVE